MDLTVVDVDRVPVEVPFRPVPARNMRRELPNWTYFEVLSVELRSGDVGFGETMCYYTWERTTDEDVERALGANAAALMWDDSLGAGLQIALFDAVGRATGVPIHRLLGGKTSDRAPLAWWCIDMPPEDWASEARRAVDAGYTAMKVKGRPWFDIREQFDAVDRSTPDSFSVGIDFNNTLLDAERAVPLLSELERYPQVSLIESPVCHEVPSDPGERADSRRIYDAVSADVALHYGRSSPLPALTEPLCDGFVLTGGTRELVHNGAVAAMADMPAFLQAVGTGITAAFTLHVSGALSHATWPTVNCHQLFEHQLLTEEILVDGGSAAVPDGPGLGYDVDRDAVERYRIEEPNGTASPDRLIEVQWPDGPTMYFTGENIQLVRSARAGEMPYFERGVSTRTVPDDGSRRWRDLHERASEKPVVESA